MTTLGNAKDIGCDLWANCLNPSCGHGSKLDLDALIDKYGRDYEFAGPDSFMKNMRCRCGHLGATHTIIPKSGGGWGGAHGHN